MLDELCRFVENNGVQLPPLAQDRVQAAVLIALTDNSADPSVVLTKRSDTLSSHRGEVSLPGGKWEPQDPDLQVTALRETHEEIGVHPDLVQVKGVLPPLQTYRGIEVSPIVGIIPENLTYRPNYDELDSIFHVPLSFFVSDERIRTDRFQRQIGHHWSPAYDFDGYEIWGFTSRLLTNFLSSALDVDIGLEHPAPVKHWGPKA